MIASDGHRAAEWRPVSALAAGVEALSRLVGAERAAWMARDVPGAILDGLALPEPPPAQAPRSWLRRLRG